MKKKLALLLAGVLAVTSLTACGGNNGSANGTEGNSASANTVKVGLGIHTDLTYGSKDASADGEGATQADIHVAAVTVDADGKVVEVIVDSIQLKSTMDTTGAVVAGTESEFSTKKELGDNYAMKSIMGDACIGEWYQQAEAFEMWCVGKTATEIESALGSDGYSADETLKTGCTIKVNGLVPAVVRAIENAKVEVSADDTLGLGLVGEMSTAEFTEGVGSSQAYANMTAVTSDAEGKITACVLNSVQANFTWDETGAITSDLEAEPTTKYDLKEGYGMKETSAGIGRIEGGGEWYEQADVFMQYVIGMTASDVAAIAMDEGGYPTDDMLTTGCTMKVSAYVSAVSKALNPEY